MNNGGFLIPIAFFFMLGYVAKSIADYRLKKKIVEKGLVDDKLKHLFKGMEEHCPLNSLKWGLLSTAIGFGLLVGYQMPDYRYDPEIVFAFMLIFAGLSLLIYYFLADRILKRRNSED